MFIAVESGDIVHSTDMSEEMYSNAIVYLKTELDGQRKVFNTEYEMFRGDAFQVVYRDPAVALRASLMTKLRLLFVTQGSPVELTQALAFGWQTLQSGSLSGNMGHVFVSSGRLLDKTKRRCLAIKHSVGQPAVTLIQDFLNHHLLGITQKQAEVLYYYLQLNFPEQQIIAEKLDMTRQNVAAHLKRGGGDLIKHTIEFFETSCEGAVK